MIAEAPLTGGRPDRPGPHGAGKPSKFTVPAGVAVDGGHVYWANSGTGTINEAPLTGGPVTTLVTGQPSPVGVAVSP
jgi:hypothetical protein